jgi:hypothetical protein
LQKLRDARIQQDMLDREASILRAKTQAALAEGISWGMTDDAIEESAEVSCLFTTAGCSCLFTTTGCVFSFRSELLMELYSSLICAPLS